MAVSIKTYQSKGSMNFGTTQTPVYKELWNAEFECDTISDLSVLNPLESNFAFPSVMLMVPSIAHIIEGNLKYAMKSDGTWELQEESPFKDIYTKSQTDAAIAQAVNDVESDVHDVEVIATRHDAVIDWMLNVGGAKNFMPNDSGSNTAVGNTWYVCPISLPAGNYIVHFDTVHSTNTDTPRSGRIAFLDSNSDPTASYKYVEFDANGDATNVNIQVTINNDSTTQFRVYPAQTYQASVGDEVTFTGCGIIPEALYNQSAAIPPYTPTLRQLYELVMSYHSGRGVTLNQSQRELSRDDIEER